MNREIPVFGWVAMTIAVVALAVGAFAFGTSVAGHSAEPGGMMGGNYGYGGNGPGMMGGYGAGSNGAQPGTAGFVAGTTESPRVVQVVAGPGYAFSPSAITVERGETVTFTVTTIGPLVHEFMVGPADTVAADKEGTPEVADIGMMRTKSLTYTFDGSGPYAYACHADGHYEAGMRGTITVVG